MLSAICFNVGQSRILSSDNWLNGWSFNKLMNISENEISVTDFPTVWNEV